MNKEVSVTDLQVTAQAEEGLVIAAYTNNGADAPEDSAFSSTDEAYNSHSGETLLPTFTADATDWYHQTSLKSNDGQDYAEETASKLTLTNGADSDGQYYYEMNKFQIKSYGSVKGTTSFTQAVYVKNVEVQSRTTQTYDPSLRILIKTADATLIFAQDGVATSSGKTTFSLLGSSPSYDLTAENTKAAKIINAASTTPTDVEIYMYYDGEDPACKSDNIADFTAMTVNVTFTSVVPDDNGE